MTESNNNKEWVYVLVGVGITLLAVVAVFSFLTNRKVEKMSWQAESGTQQQTNPIQGLGLGFGSVPVSNQLQIAQPVVYDERIYKMLVDNEQKIHEHLEDVNSNINNLNSNLKSINYGQYKIPFAGIAPRAGSVTSIRTGVEDKIRQKDFGMN